MENEKIRASESLTTLLKAWANSVLVTFANCLSLGGEFIKNSKCLSMDFVCVLCACTGYNVKYNFYYGLWSGVWRTSDEDGWRTKTR